MEKKRRGRPPKNKPEIEEIKQPLEDGVVELFVIGLCTNRSWLKCVNDDKEKCYLQIPNIRLAEKLLNKWVKGERIDGADETHYIYIK
jgi:hypothetical protein